MYPKIKNSSGLQNKERVRELKAKGTRSEAGQQSGLATDSVHQGRVTWLP